MIGKLDYRPPDAPLEVLHADDSILIVNKPDGLLTVPGKATGFGGLPARPSASEIRRGVVGPQAGSRHVGAHGFCAPPGGAAAYRAAIRAKACGEDLPCKGARARRGRPQGGSSCLLPSIGPIGRCRKSISTRGKPAETEWEVLSFEQDATRLKFMPKTGRSHQLRVHARAIGHPIMGDPLYGFDDRAQLLSTGSSCTRRHCGSLHPEDGERIAFTSPCPF